MAEERSVGSGVAAAPDKFPVKTCLSATQEAWLLGVALGASGVGGILLDVDDLPVLAGHRAHRFAVPMVLAMLTAAWVWTLPETRQRDLAAIER